MERERWQVVEAELLGPDGSAQGWQVVHRPTGLPVPGRPFRGRGQAEAAADDLAAGRVPAPTWTGTFTLR